jgi:hypothetical protein
MNYEDLVKNHAGQMIDRLVSELITEEKIDVRFEDEDEEPFSSVVVHIYEEDNEISLRLYTENRFQLYFGYYDDEDEFHEITRDLSEEESNAIPKSLKKAMSKVFADEEGIRLPGNFLSR